MPAHHGRTMKKGFSIADIVLPLLLMVVTWLLAVPQADGDTAKPAAQERRMRAE